MKAPLKRILYAEDEPDIQEVTILALETLGEFLVKACRSGSQIIELARSFQPDLVLLDVMMPDMDGPTTLTALHGTAGFESTPVIFMTAKAMEREIQQLKDMGALAVITKPYDPATLCARIEEIWQHGGD